MKNLFSKLSLNKTDIKALLISFAVINFAFLYHTLNFMWGNHDVKFIKEELKLTSGLFEGRFTQFIPYRLLTDGQILPILNNLLGLAFLTLALLYLAKYWKLKDNLLLYTLFISFTATQPYTLSWLYFTFITISCLLWTLLAILGLYISAEISQSNQKISLSALSILFFYLTLGGYPPIINLIFVCLAGKIIMTCIFEKKSLSEIFNIHKYTVINIFIAALLFKLTLKFVMPDNVYNLETTALQDLPKKFIATVFIAFKQFFVTVPFMEKGYKSLLAAMSFCAVIFAFYQTSGLKNKIIVTFMLCGIIWLTSLTTFLVTPHTEYVSRIDFYGFAFLYAFFTAVLFKSEIKLSPSLAVIFMIILIPFNITNDYRALRTWKLGFDAELKILDDITERIEAHPQFNPQTQYRFYQIGDISLRPTYYNGKFSKEDVFLLDLPYLAMWQGSNLVEFYSPFSYINHEMPILPIDITPEVYDFIYNKARPWPHANAVYLNRDIILIFLNQVGLTDFQKRLNQLNP